MTKNIWWEKKKKIVNVLNSLVFNKQRIKENILPANPTRIPIMPEQKDYPPSCTVNQLQPPITPNHYCVSVQLMTGGHAVCHYWVSPLQHSPRIQTNFLQSVRILVQSSHTSSDSIPICFESSNSWSPPPPSLSPSYWDSSQSLNTSRDSILICFESSDHTGPLSTPSHPPRPPIVPFAKDSPGVQIWVFQRFDSNLFKSSDHTGPLSTTPHPHPPPPPPSNHSICWRIPAIWFQSVSNRPAPVRPPRPPPSSSPIVAICEGFPRPFWIYRSADRVVVSRGTGSALQV